jgi:lipoprotein NlpI
MVLQEMVTMMLRMVVTQVQTQVLVEEVLLTKVEDKLHQEVVMVVLE